MTTLDFSPMSLSAAARESNDEHGNVFYSITKFMDRWALSVYYHGRMFQLSTFISAHHAAVAAMEHWQELAERINSALPGERVAIPEKAWATVPEPAKTVIVPATEMKRHIAENLMAHDIGGES